MRSRRTNLGASLGGEHHIAVVRLAPLRVDLLELMAGRAAAVDELVVRHRQPLVPVADQLVGHRLLTRRADGQRRRLSAVLWGGGREVRETHSAGACRQYCGAGSRRE